VVSAGRDCDDRSKAAEGWPGHRCCRPNPRPAVGAQRDRCELPFRRSRHSLQAAGGVAWPASFAHQPTNGCIGFQRQAELIPWPRPLRPRQGRGDFVLAPAVVARQDGAALHAGRRVGRDTGARKTATVGVAQAQLAAASPSEGSAAASVAPPLVEQSPAGYQQPAGESRSAILDRTAPCPIIWILSWRERETSTREAPLAAYPRPHSWQTVRPGAVS